MDSLIDGVCNAGRDGDLGGETIGLYWKRKNARRNGLTAEEKADAVVVVR
jgi:hypothetical protein